MSRTLFFVVFSFACFCLSAQQPEITAQRESPTVFYQLVHTKLDLRFDYGKRWVVADAWITLQPHAYTSDSLTLDAKGMTLQQVALVDHKRLLLIPYTYDGL